MLDSAAFGTGLHPTTALCLEAIDDELTARPTTEILDIGTGSGILALAALVAGVSRAIAIDIDEAAIRVAVRNAELNALSPRFIAVRSEPDALSGRWPLVVANVLSAPLTAMASVLSSRVDRSGRLILSGVRSSLAGEVARAYVRTGMRHVQTRERNGWVALTLSASW